MKTLFNSLIILLSISLTAHAQHEYRLTKSGGQLKINFTNVSVEGYNGKEIIFQGEKIEAEPTDERAKGLVPLSQSGYSDNTGLGISVADRGDEVIVNPSSRKNVGTIRIKVPENMKVSIKNYGDRLGLTTTLTTDDQEEMVLKNLKNELEVSVYSNNIKLENNSGPMNIKTVTGSVEATFSDDIKGPVSIISTLNFVDVSIPKTTKANIQLSSGAGKIYAAKEFDITFEKPDVYRPNISYELFSEPVSAVTVKGSGTSGVKGETAVVKNGNAAPKSNSAAIAATGKNQNKNDRSSDEINAVHMMRDNTSNLAALTLNSNFSYVINGGERVKGKINGGGMDLILKSNSKNIYLRQK